MIGRLLSVIVIGLVRLYQKLIRKFIWKATAVPSRVLMRREWLIAVESEWWDSAGPAGMQSMP